MLVLCAGVLETQSHGSDCGIVAIAYVCDMCSGFNPWQVRCDHGMIRHHLATCLENCQFARFPVKGEHETVAVKSSTTVDLHCSCHMPEQTGDELAKCDSCHVWYHRHCMDIPSEVFSGSHVFWKCKTCCASDW